MSGAGESLRFVERLLANNLLPAIVAGAIAWLLVAAGVRLLDIRHGRLRLCLYLAAPIKSTLVLLGLTPVLAWPQEVFGPWSARAVGASTMIPLFLVVAGLGFLARAWISARERATALRDAAPATERSPRLAAAYRRVTETFARDRGRIAAACGGQPPAATPPLLVTRHDLGSPLAVVDGPPVIVFPETLIERLDDAQLEGALAHEIAHLHVRRWFSCTSSELLRRLTAVNPFGMAMAAQLELEEEKACDDMAVAATGDAAAYAGMLLAGYRYASGRTGAPVLASLPRLLGIRPTLAQRIERQLAERPPIEYLGRQRAGFWLLWGVLVVTLFSA